MPAETSCLRPLGKKGKGEDRISTCAKLYLNGKET